MKTKSISEVLHFDPSHPCCETPASADLFPDLLRLVHNRQNRGRIASVLIESFGIGIQSRRLSIDESAWNECVKTPNFRPCYDLSMANLAMNQSMFAQ